MRKIKYGCTILESGCPFEWAIKCTDCEHYLKSLDNNSNRLEKLVSQKMRKVYYLARIVAVKPK